MRYLIPLCITAILGACGQTNQHTVATVLQDPKDVLVFIDKSKSVSYKDSAVLKKTMKSVFTHVNMLQNPNDRIYVYFIHGNTASSSADTSYVIPALPNTKNKSALERNTAMYTYNTEVKRQKEAVAASIKRRLAMENSCKTENNTDIIGALEVISRKHSARKQKHVLLLTDGIQACTGFAFSNFTDRKHALNAASLHLKSIDNRYNIQKDALNGVHISMVAPVRSIDNDLNKFVQDYWERFLNEYSVQVQFN